MDKPKLTILLVLMLCGAVVSSHAQIISVGGGVGGGVQQSIGRHLAVRAQLDMLTFLFLPWGVRGSVGVTVPLGRAR